MGKRSRERSGGERHKLEKKARLSEGPSVKEGTEEADEDSLRALEVFCPLVVEIADSPEGAPPAGPEVPFPGGEPTDETAGISASGSAPVSGDTPAVLEEHGGVAEVGSALMEGRREPVIRDASPEEVRGVVEGVDPAGIEQVLIVEEEEDSDGEGERRGDAIAEASPVRVSGRLAAGLAELPEGSQVETMLEEARRLKAPQPEAVQVGLSGENDQSDPVIEAAFAQLMKSVLHPGVGPSANSLVDLDLVDAAFGQRGAVKDIHLLPEIDNSILMRMIRSYTSRVSYDFHVVGIF